MFSYQLIGLLKLQTTKIEIYDPLNPSDLINTLCCYLKINEKLFDIVIFNPLEAVISNLVVKKNDFVTIVFKNLKNKSQEFGKITLEISKFPEQQKYSFSDWMSFDDLKYRAYLVFDVEWVNSLQQLSKSNGSSPPLEESKETKTKEIITTLQKNEDSIQQDDLTFKIEKFEANLLKYLNDLENKKELNYEQIDPYLKNIQIQYKRIFNNAENKRTDDNQENKKIFESRRKIQNIIAKIEEKVEASKKNKLEKMKDSMIEAKESIKRQVVHTKQKSEVNFDKVINNMDNEINLISQIITTKPKNKNRENEKSSQYDLILNENKKTIENLEKEIKTLRHDNLSLIEEIEKLKNFNNHNKVNKKLDFENSPAEDDLSALYEVVNLISNNPGMIMNLFFKEIRQGLKKEESRNLYDAIEKINLNFHELNEKFKKSQKQNLHMKNLSPSPHKCILEDSEEKTETQILEETYDDGLKSLSKNVSSASLKRLDRERSLSFNKKTDDSDTKKNTEKIAKMLSDYQKKKKPNIEMKQINNENYLFGNKKVFLKILNGNLVVRIGGGYISIQDYIFENFTSKITRTDSGKKGNTSPSPKKTSSPISRRN